MKRILLGLFYIVVFCGSIYVGFAFALSQAWKDAEARYPGGSAIMNQQPDPVYHTVCISSPWTSEFNQAITKYLWYVPAAGIASLAACYAIGQSIGKGQKK
ncbi:MAG: hypothetical protein K2W95_20750 [Candidatus Obscuribacterales bacterium]|nr:hypothetical protein [Candidatus Obscuribacterales bacterium]